MSGTVFLVVGPSGAGKDTLIRAAAALRPALVVARRAVTRDAQAGGEEIESLTPAEFAAREAAGGFVLSWRAHGLAYGIPAEMEQARAAGRDVIANVSRTVIGQARARLAPLRILSVEAPGPVLAARLARRGRESPGEIADRLARARSQPAPEGPDVVRIVNDRPLAEVLPEFLAALQPVSA